MSKKPGGTKQHDSDFAEYVRTELENPIPQAGEKVLLSSVRCAALAVLARPEAHARLLRRLRRLLAASVDRSTLRELSRFISLCRALLYEEGQETHLTVSEAARRLGVARSTIYRWLGDTEMFLSPMHDDPDLGPDRIPIATFRQMTQRAAEKNEADDLKEALETDLPDYEVRMRDEVMERLGRADGPLDVHDIQRVAVDLGIEVSAATIRRSPASSIDRSLRGRPRRIYRGETAARLLARRARRQRAKAIRSVNTLLQTLRRLRNEIPTLAPALGN